MLLARLVLSTVPETRCSRIPELQEENVVEHRHVWTIHETQPADPHLATALEKRFVGNRGKQTQSDVVDERRVLPAMPARKLKSGHFGYTP
jgi:hypothetical protein